MPPHLTETVNIDRAVMDISPDDTVMIRIEATGGNNNYSYVSDILI